MPSRGVEADGQFVQFSCGSLLSTNVPAASALRDVVIDAWSNVTNSLPYTSISQHDRAGSNQRGQTRTEDNGPTIEDAFTYIIISRCHFDTCPRQSTAGVLDNAKLTQRSVLHPDKSDESVGFL